MLRKCFAILFCFITLFTFVVMADAAQTGIAALTAEWTSDGQSFSVKWTQVEDRYFLFMPGDVDLSQATLHIDASEDVLLGDAPFSDATPLSELALGEELLLTCGQTQYSLTILQSSAIASLHITTESGSMAAVHADKDHKEAADIVILSDGKVQYSEPLDYIKGRGNSTWNHDKKPYNIKFESKIDLFGMGKAKKWSLLANYRDTSLIRNYIAFDIAQQLEMEFTSQNCYADLYINGEYYGNYTIYESVEVGSTRVDIENLEDANEEANDGFDIEELPLGGEHTKDYLQLTKPSQKWVWMPYNPDDISGGYLLEFDMHSRYVSEVSGFVTDRLQCVVLKSPEYASEAQVKYISSLYQEFEDAVFSETGYNSAGKHYSEYIDMESFVKMYVFQEYIKNLDAGITSFYLYKDAGDDKFYAAPVWDFDNALGKTYTLHGMQLSDPQGWWANTLYYEPPAAAEILPTLLSTLFGHDDFYALSAKLWNEEFSALINDELFADYSALVQKLTDAAVMDCILWNHYASSDPEKVAAKYIDYCNNRVLKFMKDRKSFLDAGFSDTAVRIFYDANGAAGAVFNTKALQLGDTLVLPDKGLTNGALFFAGWNTEPDGSGNAYPAGASITLRKATYRFYAQWVENEEDIYDQIYSKDLLLLGKAVFEQFFRLLKDALLVIKTASSII